MNKSFAYGYRAETGAWLFDDCSFTQEGQRVPRNQQDRQLIHGGPRLGQPPTRDEASCVFKSFTADLFDTFGGYSGWAALGLTTAYASAPELVAMGGHPGLWLHGRMAGGKTTIARWLMRVWGFETFGVRAGISTTTNGMMAALNQYSCLPVWLDDFRTDSSDHLSDTIRGGFDRAKTSKGVGRSVSALTSLIITGEQPAQDAATRSRYLHLEVDPAKQNGDNAAARYRRCEQSRDEYRRIGCFLMQQRPHFARAVTENLHRWMNETIEITNERTRHTYGACYCAFVAANSVLEASYPVADFRKFVVNLAVSSQL